MMTLADFLTVYHRGPYQHQVDAYRQTDVPWFGLDPCRQLVEGCVSRCRVADSGLLVSAIAVRVGDVEVQAGISLANYFRQG